jgi:methyltransferase-like protein/trans-aconitate methyltransferase
MQDAETMKAASPTAGCSTTSYDEIPYESGSFPQTHPDRLATLARLLGLEPAPVDRCRVLELGCAMGANLVPMAFQLPGSEFVGVDSSARQVAAARTAAADLGLANIRIEHQSILGVDRGWGQFDYLICHGVYSWVTDPVQHKILAIAADNLAPHGIAYVSYNTYPGWHLREMIRRMMLYHASQFGDASERIEQARALLDFLAGAVDTTTYYGALLQSELQLVKRVRNSYLFHDHLAEINEPVYFHEFVSRAHQHGLQYLADADVATMLTSGFPPKTAETLERISPDIVRAEQYMDFLRNRSFRQTLLCHRQREVSRKLQIGNLEGLLVASPVMPVGTLDGGDGAFEMPDGRRVETTFPLTQAALTVLGQHWPMALDQTTLRSMAVERVGSPPTGDQLQQQWTVVLEDILHCYSTGTMELHTWHAPCVNHVSLKPQVSRMVAQQARAGSLVTNQRHEATGLDTLGTYVAPLLDGTRDRDALVVALADCVARGDIGLREGPPSLTGGEYTIEVLAGALHQTLDTFARRALLVA